MIYLITGGAGFIGSNFARKLLDKGNEIIILDNLSKKGATLNVNWLKNKYGKKLTVIKSDISYRSKSLKNAVSKADVVYHLAAQTSVTTSITNPQKDFDTNLLGTFNILESIRRNNPKAVLLYSSTNKVYGSMENLEIVEDETRYTYAKIKAVSESYPTDFHSPYGCSKGSADQYIRDYARIYGLQTVVFRQSCIYGERQLGVEDQGWVAWFIIAAILGKQITIFGDGKQTRDLLYVDDLFNAWDLALKKIEMVKGKAFNIGGGPENSLSIMEFINMLQEKIGKRIHLKYSKWRLGDQKIFISDNQYLSRELGWAPKTPMIQGLDKLIQWVSKNQSSLNKLFH